MAKLAPSPTGPSVVSFVVEIDDDVVDTVEVVVDSEVTGWSLLQLDSEQWAENQVLDITRSELEN